jgi:hypothetical protein
MRRALKSWICATALLLAVVLPAAAVDVVDPHSLGAAVVLPYLTTADVGDRITIASVTNGLTQGAVNLHAIWISGDQGEDWAALDYDCALTPLETTYFVFEREPGGTAQVTFECSDLGQTFPNNSATNNIVTRSVPGQDGIMFLTVECQLGSDGCARGPLANRTLRTNALVGSATVIDMGQGRGFSISGIHIQGIASAEEAAGDRHYIFDGSPGEYAPFPSSLTANFVAPDDSTTLELMLFTLDGTVNGGPGIIGSLGGYAFDDDENPTSGSLRFDCFTVQDLTEPPPYGFGRNLRSDFGGHLVGHLQLFPGVALAADVHEYVPGTGDGSGARRRPVHGWVLQSVTRLSDMVGTGNRTASTAMWARTLGQGTNPLVALGDDTPSLNAKLEPLETGALPVAP